MSRPPYLQQPEKTMKVMAIGTLKPLSQEQRQRYLPKEVPATLQLYLDGKMEQFWMRNKEAGVISAAQTPLQQYHALVSVVSGEMFSKLK
jgi:hypothetical protein